MAVICSPNAIAIIVIPIFMYMLLRASINNLNMQNRKTTVPISPASHVYGWLGRQLRLEILGTTNHANNEVKIGFMK